MKKIDDSSSDNTSLHNVLYEDGTRDITAPKNRQFTIVGIGGSTGSLEAIEQFFRVVPVNSGIAFVVVQHHDPDQKSMLPELLRQCTEMPVHSIEDGMAVEPNNIYVIPENKELAILNGRLLLMQPSKPVAFRMPIDNFFQSLAEDWGEKAVCIIFSGMGSDGELGARFIKEGFGLVMVQDPASASYDGMPRSAIQTGMVDFIEEPAAIADKLMEYIKYPVDGNLRRELITDRKLSNAIQKIFVMLRTRTGHDFSLYKKNTLLRRFQRRMNIHYIMDIDNYVRYLQENPEEVEVLFKELLIGVTKFFRDAPAFELLGEKVIPDILKNKGKNEALRVWIAGCSTGEEAYTIAILIREAIGKLKSKHPPKIQLYATDLDPDAIRRARAGLYMDNISNDMSAERLEKWFIKKDDQYQVIREIREMVVFAEHNLIKDASFIKLDLLTCRNLMIYLTPELQRKLLPVFHYTLLPGGILFLGPSETISGHEDLFMPVEAKWKIFRRRESSIAVPRLIEFPVQPSPLPRFTYSVNPDTKDTVVSTPISLPELAKKILLTKYTPAAVVINDKGTILYISGHTGKYLELAPGNPAMNIFDMAKDGLAFELRSAIIKAISRQEEVTVNEVKIKSNGSSLAVRLIIEPINRPDVGKGLLLVLFQDLPTQKHSRRKSAQPVLHEDMTSEKDQLIAELEKELRFTREHLQQTIEEMETSFEELKSTNEELQSTNEESNTAKEEMQALNEELMTVNMEFRAKAEELTEVNNDMINLLNNSEVATIFVNSKLDIKRFTNQATKIVNLIQSDIGRPITHISSNLKYDRLASDVREVIERLLPKEIRVETLTGHWYCMKISPYRTLENFIDGAVITFMEVTVLKKVEEELEDSRIFMQHLINSITDSILVLDNNLRIISANQSFLQLFRAGEEQVIGRYVYELGTGQWQIPALRKLMEEILPSKVDFDNYLVEQDFNEVGFKKLRFKGSRFVQPKSHTEMILLVIQPVY